MNLSEFLLARIADDEVAARAAWDHDVWSVAEDRNGETAVVQTDVTGQSWRVAVVNPNPGAHIVRWDPARVLAECEIKRRIINSWHGSPDGGDQLETVLDLMAEVYIDHPDHQLVWPRWKP